MKKVFNTTVSIKETASGGVLRGIVQYDTLVEVNIRLSDGFKAFDYTGYTNIIFKVLKPDGTTVIDSEGIRVIATSPSDGIVTVLLAGQTTVVAGLCQCLIEIYSSGGKMATARLNYEVFESLEVNEGAVESSDEYPVLQNLLSDMSSLESAIDIAEGQRMLNESARVSAELARESKEIGYVAQAREWAEEAEKYAKMTADTVGGDFATRAELEAVAGRVASVNGIRPDEQGKLTLAATDIHGSACDFGEVDNEDLLAWASAQSVSGSFIVSPSVTTKNVPKTSWYTGWLDNVGGHKRISITVSSGADAITYTNVTAGGVWMGWTSIAPSGFGLGESCKVITDWNTATKNGWYMNTTEEGNANAPTNAVWYGLVTAQSPTLVVQEVWRINSQNSATKRIRWLRYDTWSDWEYYNPPMQPDVEYKTTERYNTLPVYKKLDANGGIVWKVEGETEWRGDAKVGLASYVGTGVMATADSPMILQFDFAPDVVMLLGHDFQNSDNGIDYSHFKFDNCNDNGGNHAATQIMQLWSTEYTRGRFFGNGYGTGKTGYGKKSADGKTLYWYDLDTNAGATNLNFAGYTYYYLGIKFGG